jgi:Four helix bundle sensory module for signal transduction
VFGKTRLPISLALSGTLVLLVAAGFLIVSHIRSLAAVIVDDNLPGLSYAGKAKSGQADAFIRTMLYLASESAERAKLKQEIETITEKNSDALLHYKSSIYAREDQQLYENVRHAREAYLQTRQKVFSAAAPYARDGTAFEVSKSELMRAHEAYRAALGRLFEYNRNVGRLSGERIMTACSAAQWALAALTVAIFAIGFGLGLHPLAHRQ